MEPRSPGPAPQHERSAASDLFGVRLLETLFRRWPVYLVLMLLFVLIGVAIASRLDPAYTSRAVLSASSNPLVDDPNVRGTDIAMFETPAQGTARIISEQLGTTQFIASVAERADIVPAAQLDLFTEDLLRSRISASPEGNNFFAIEVVWGDPVTAQRLVQATTDMYTEYLTSTVVADSAAAVDFFEERRVAASERVLSAQRDLDSYISGLQPVPEGQERSVEEELTIQRLNSALDRAEMAVEEAQSGIDEARLAVLQAESAAGQVLQVIDPPTLPIESDSAVRDLIVLVATFTVLGAVVVAMSVLVSARLDHAVRSTADIGSDRPVVTVSRARALETRRFGLQRRRNGRSGPSLPISTT